MSEQTDTIETLAADIMRRAGDFGPTYGTVDIYAASLRDTIECSTPVDRTYRWWSGRDDVMLDRIHAFITRERERRAKAAKPITSVLPDGPVALQTPQRPKWVPVEGEPGKYRIDAGMAGVDRGVGESTIVFNVHGVVASDTRELAANVSEQMRQARERYVDAAIMADYGPIDRATHDRVVRELAEARAPRIPTAADFDALDAHLVGVAKKHDALIPDAEAAKKSIAALRTKLADIWMWADRFDNGECAPSGVAKLEPRDVRLATDNEEDGPSW